MDQNIAKQTFAFIACVDIIWLVVRVWIYLIYWISTIEQDWKNKMNIRHIVQYICSKFYEIITISCFQIELD